MSRWKFTEARTEIKKILEELVISMVSIYELEWAFRQHIVAYGHRPMTKGLLEFLALFLLLLLFTSLFISSFKWNIMKRIWEKLGPNLWSPVPVTVTQPIELKRPENVSYKKIISSRKPLTSIGRHSCFTYFRATYVLFDHSNANGLWRIPTAINHHILVNVSKIVCYQISLPLRFEASLANSIFQSLH